ncbi:MAG: acyl-CoA dehydrogenase family protein [Myxococcota bacterium]
MPNFFTDNDDLRFYIDQYIDWEKLVGLVELNYTAKDAPKNWEEALEGYKEILSLVGDFVANEVAPRAAAIDEQGVHMDADGKVEAGEAQKAIFSQLDEMGIYGLSVPRELGGMNLPLLVYFVINELMGRGDVSTMTHFAFHPAVAACLVQYSLVEGSAKFDDAGRLVSTRWDAYIRDIIENGAWGSMDLTEPGAGSDLAAIRTKAVKDDAGVWRLTGNKIFITSGHGKYHLVLAKTEDREDLDALSLFVAPLTIERDGETIRNAWVDRVEEKIGHHGSATCSVQYEDSEADLIGEEGRGFKMMLMLMNGARVGVGFESIGLMEAAYRMAREYAAERVSMGKTIDRHEMIANYLDEMDLLIHGTRALAMDAAFAEETAMRLQRLATAQPSAQAGDEVKKRFKRNKGRSRRLTPLLKYAAAENAVYVARMNMQILGGNGYMKDYAAERLLRDALVLPVYEGTSQIQALMVFKDIMTGVMKRPKRFVQQMAQAKLDAVTSRDAHERGYHSMRSLAFSAQQRILLRIAKRKAAAAMSGPLPKFFDTFLRDWDPKRDFSFGMLHAEHLCRILVDVEVAGIFLKQAEQYPERRVLAERWIERAEPRVRYHWDLIVGNSHDRLLAKLRDANAEVDDAGAAEHVTH